MGGISPTFLQSVIRQVDLAGRFWFGQPREVAEDVLESSDWQADAQDAYCWRCGGSVGPGEWTRRGCTGCRDRPERRIADGVVRLGPYSGELRDWIVTTKYQNWHEMGSALGRRLGSQVRRSGMVDAKRAIVVPMPMPWQRRMFRGIDHAGVMAAAVAKDMRATLVPMLRRTNGPTQTSLEPAQRRTNAKRGISLRRRLGGWPLEELEVEVVLVDDVSTTGSSLRAAVRLLRELKPLKVVSAVVAVSDERARKARQQMVESIGAGSQEEAGSAEAKLSGANSLEVRRNLADRKETRTKAE